MSPYAYLEISLGLALAVAGLTITLVRGKSSYAVQMSILMFLAGSSIGAGCRVCAASMNADAAAMLGLNAPHIFLGGLALAVAGIVTACDRFETVLKP